MTIACDLNVSIGHIMLNPTLTFSHPPSPPSSLSPPSLDSSSSEEKIPLVWFHYEMGMMSRYAHHMKLLELWKKIKEDESKDNEEKLSHFKDTELAKEDQKVIS